MQMSKAAVILLTTCVALASAHFLLKKKDLTVTEANKQAARESHNPIGVVAVTPRYEYGKYSFDDVAVLESGEIWGVGYDGKDPNRVYHSTDSGKHWETISIPGTGFSLKALSFPDGLHGWLVGGYGLILRTSDGGKSWSQLERPTTSGLHAVHFLNPLVGYVAGRTGVKDPKTGEETHGIEILCTKDGGETWRRCYQDDESISVFQITTVSESRAFVSLGDRLIRTDDQGKTWQPVKLSAKYISSIEFAADGTGWLVGSHGVFQQSTDGGSTWQQPPALPQDFVNRDWWAIAFNSNGIGLAVGENSTLALTTDNGKTWELQTSIKSDHLRAVRMQDSRAVILGAQNAYSINVTLANTQQAKSK